MTRAVHRLVNMTRNAPGPGLPLAAVVLAALLLMGLGNGGDANRSNIPVPERNYSATVTDRQGSSVEAERFTWEGKVFFKAHFGSAAITLPFEKLSELTLQHQADAGSPDMIAASALLKTGETVQVTLERSTKCFGTTRFGDYEIFIKDVGSIKFK